MIKLDLPRELRTVDSGFTYKVVSVGLLTSRFGVEICTNSPRPRFDGILADLDNILQSVGCHVLGLEYESIPNGSLYTFLYSFSFLSTKDD